MTASAASVDCPSMLVLVPYAGHDSHEVLQAVLALPLHL